MDHRSGRDGRIHPSSSMWLAASVVMLASMLATGESRAQVPQPRVPDLAERSGLVSRYTPVLPRLPHDRDRDSFEGTRYQDEHDDKPKLRPYNSLKDGGMYGRPLSSDCTAAVYPFFHGSPGSTITEDCRGHDPVTGRWITNLIFPFKPVGMYYDRGVYVPIYDFRYAVPGPGPFPWPHFFKRPTGG